MIHGTEWESHVSPESRLIRVAVQTGDTFDAGASTPLFAIPVSTVLGRNRYLVADGGQRFLAMSPSGSPSVEPVTVVLNWNQGLER